MSTAELIKAKIVEVSEVLNSAAPGLPTLLRTIHSELKKDPAIVTLLTNEECSIFVNGLKEHTKIELACVALKGKPRKALSKTTIDDL